MSSVKCVIYARYSSTKQDEISIEAQVRACKEYAANRDYIVLKVYTDEAISGKGTKTQSRKQYQALLRDSKQGSFDVVLVHRYDRIARNVGEHVNLELKLSENNISLVAVSQDFGQSKEAKIMKTMMWALSEYYIENLADETKKGHREVALKGLHNGGCPPFGYDIKNQQYIINEKEAYFVKKIFNCALKKEGFKEIVSEINKSGMVGKRGKPIRYTQVYEILRNEKYTGVYKYSLNEESNRSLRRAKPNAIRIEGALPQIINKALFLEVQKIMDERKQTGKKSNYLCSGLVYCGNCGSKMYGTITRRKGHEYKIFYCHNKCGTGTVSMDEIDKTVQEYITQLLSPGTILSISNTLKEYASNEKKRVNEFNSSIKLQIDEKQKQINNYMISLGSGVLPAEVISDIGNQIVSLKNEIKVLAEMPVPKDYTTKEINAWLNNLRKSTNERDTVLLLVERIDATKTAINVKSTLTTVLCENGCGSRT
ncbi:recombinase family protein [Ruminiclostridium cellulolyticum]|uniref:Resolvase domain protein n=1 Tax=Ruminiclostridium cellulolyticum (strain ATCC 35319 / DSM 5812 / JCM 6584 / H10) TaxID=394503 RepID=B8I938_RUMCH|nr:recombinase family protein [Ruminiclostridium cellulolyticum]ACL77370.1 Resolvase domain protein [Ruminiclostridium cellulolyticum H10]